MGSPRRGWEGARGPGGVCSEFGGIGGGGYIFLAITSISGPKKGQNFKISPVL